MTDPLPRRIAWFAPWTWKRRWVVAAALAMALPVVYVLAERPTEYPKPASTVQQRPVYVAIPLDDYQRVILAASIKRVPVNKLALELMQPGLKRLREHPPQRDDDD